jgi:hypothetical protein
MLPKHINMFCNVSVPFVNLEFVRTRQLKNEATKVQTVFSLGMGQFFSNLYKKYLQKATT